MYACLNSLGLLSAQFRAIVGEILCAVGKFGCFLHLLDGKTPLRQLRLLLRLSVMVKIYGSTSHCIPTDAIWFHHVLGLGLVEASAFKAYWMDDLHR